MESGAKVVPFGQGVAEREVSSTNGDWGPEKACKSSYAGRLNYGDGIDVGCDNCGFVKGLPADLRENPDFGLRR